MKKLILVLLSIISVLFLVGCDTKKNVNSDMQENNSNQNQESIANSGENTSGEYKLYSEFKNITLDLTQPISISELLERNKLEIQSNQEHELNLGEFKIGNNSGELSISVKNQLVVKINGNIVHEYEADLIDCATLVMFKNYIICTDNYDFAGGYAYVFNEYGEKVYEFQPHQVLRRYRTQPAARPENVRQGRKAAPAVCAVCRCRKRIIGPLPSAAGRNFVKKEKQQL